MQYCESFDWCIGLLLSHCVFPSTIINRDSVTRMVSRYSYPSLALYRFPIQNGKFEKNLHNHRMQSMLDALFKVTKKEPLGGFDAYG